MFMIRSLSSILSQGFSPRQPRNANHVGIAPNSSFSKSKDGEHLKNLKQKGSKKPKQCTFDPELVDESEVFDIKYAIDGKTLLSFYSSIVSRSSSGEVLKVPVCVSNPESPFVVSKITVTIGEDSVVKCSFLIGKEDLYCWAWKVKELWYTFSDCPHTLLNTTTTGIRCCYTKMGVPVVEMLGPGKFVHALLELGRATSTAVMGNPLKVVIYHMCEPCRFLVMRSFITALISPENAFASSNVTGQIKLLINEWERFSKYVFRLSIRLDGVELDPENAKHQLLWTSLVHPRIARETGMTMVGSFCGILGVMKYSMVAACEDVESDYAEMKAKHREGALSKDDAAAWEVLKKEFKFASEFLKREAAALKLK